MPRFRIDPRTAGSAESGDLADDFDDLHDELDRSPKRRRNLRSPGAPRLVLEGKSGHRTADADGAPDPNAVQDENTAEARAVRGLTITDPNRPAAAADDESSPYSSYDVATHGPDPIPDWLVTSLSARDTRLGTIKSGKEADVGLLDRSLPGGPGCLLAVKTFRSADHRMFHRDAGYQEGRRIRRSRETRAMAARTGFGRELLAGQWATAEFVALCRIWKAGARVPYPVQVIGSELMMEFIGDPDGTAARRLAAVDASSSDFTELYHDLVSTLEVLADAGLTHGDLSPYNVLVDEGGCVLIDLPQVVDLVANPQGEQFLRRDCRNIADFFARRGVLAADPEILAVHLGGIARG